MEAEQKVYRVKDLQLGDYLVIERQEAKSKFRPTFIITAIYIKTKEIVRFWSNAYLYEFIITKNPQEFQIHLEYKNDNKVITVDGYEPPVTKIKFETNKELREKLGLLD